MSEVIVLNLSSQNFSPCQSLHPVQVATLTLLQIPSLALLSPSSAVHFNAMQFPKKVNQKGRPSTAELPKYM